MDLCTLFHLALSSKIIRTLTSFGRRLERASWAVGLARDTLFAYLQEGLHSTELYSVASDQWVEKAPMSDQRFAFGAVYANEGVYAAGGHLFCNDTLTEDCGNR